MAFDRSILKSPIKIISLDSSETTSIIDTNLSVQVAGSEGLQYRNPTRIGEVFLQFDFQPNTFYHTLFKLSKTCSRHSFMDTDNEASVISLCGRTYQTETAMWGDMFYSATITLVPQVTLVLHGLLPLHPLYNIHVLLHNI